MNAYVFCCKTIREMLQGFGTFATSLFFSDYMSSWIVANSYKFFGKAHAGCCNIFMGVCYKLCLIFIGYFRMQLTFVSFVVKVNVRCCKIFMGVCQSMCCSSILMLFAYFQNVANIWLFMYYFFHNVVNMFFYNFCNIFWKYCCETMFCCINFFEMLQN
jgi:hypothetical protein